MYTPSHLLLRSGIFYFRIAVPNRQRPAFSGRTEFCFSLGTRNKKSAAESLVFVVTNRANLDSRRSITDGNETGPPQAGLSRSTQS